MGTEACPGLASDTSAALFHASYWSLWHEPVEWSRMGPEQLARVRDDVERRAGGSRFAAWFDEGRALELDHAVRVAAELVDHHRH